MAIINQHLSIPASISNVVRLGKRTEDRDKPRLLRITVDSDQTKAKILRNCTKIRNIKEPEYLQQVYITPDLTFKERERNKLLRSKLAEMNNGQKKYRIKNGAERELIPPSTDKPVFVQILNRQSTVTVSEPHCVAEAVSPSKLSCMKDNPNDDSQINDLNIPSLNGAVHSILKENKLIHSSNHISLF